MARLTSEGAFDVMARAAALEASGREIVHLEIGEPQFPTPPHVVEAAGLALREGYTRYCPPPGLPAFREAAAAFLGRTRGVDAPAGRIVAAPGAKPLIFYAILALCEAGDEVVVPDPGFPTYASVAAFAGARTVPLPLRAANDFRLDPDELASLVGDRTRLVVLNSPHNPTGGALTTADLEAVAGVVGGRDLYVLSDEVYWSMRYDAGHVSPAALRSLCNRTILLDGCSKTFAMTGWRLGFALMPEALVEPVTRLLVNSVSCTAAFVQMAGVAALGGPAEDTDAMVAELRRRRDRMVAGLRRLPGVACPEPAGAFYAFPDIRDLGASSADVADWLLEHAGVACLPGAAFGGFGQGRPRRAYAAAPDAIAAGLEAMASALQGFP
jgi:aspartate/methionine/tyrosine aminotransferase